MVVVVRVRAVGLVPRRPDLLQEEPLGFQGLDEALHTGALRHVRVGQLEGRGAVVASLSRCARLHLLQSDLAKLIDRVTGLQVVAHVLALASLAEEAPDAHSLERASPTKSARRAWVVLALCRILVLESGLVVGVDVIPVDHYEHCPLVATEVLSNL